MTHSVRRARKLIARPFRLQGRDPAVGLDCVGLLITAFDLEPEAFPASYGWRGWLQDDVVTAADPWFRVVGKRERRPGDALLFDAGRGRMHLGLWTGRGIIHADAALGRICERPGEPPFETLKTLRRRCRERRI